MDNPAMPKGQRVCTPEGVGDVMDTMGDKVEVKLDSGETKTFPSDEVTDDSSAG
jgi:hypothetical protein